MCPPTAAEIERALVAMDLSFSPSSLETMRRDDVGGLP